MNCPWRRLGMYAQMIRRLTVRIFPAQTIPRTTSCDVLLRIGCGCKSWQCQLQLGAAPPRPGGPVLPWGRRLVRVLSRGWLTLPAAGQQLQTQLGGADGPGVGSVCRGPEASPVWPASSGDRGGGGPGGAASRPADPVAPGATEQHWLSQAPHYDNI